MSELKKYKMFIDGEWVDSDTKKTFETLNPENNKPWAVVPEASANDVDKAVKAAQKAFEGEWPKLFPRERAKYLKAIANQLRENAELLGKIETIEQITLIFCLSNNLERLKILSAFNLLPDIECPRF